jgi:hypothetical protein
LQKSIALIALLAALLAGEPATAEDRSAGDPLFADDAILEVTISAPMTTLVRERPRESYIPGQFILKNPAGGEQVFDVGLRTRGHFRHQTCGFPPLRVNFKKGAVKGTFFDGQDKLKMVVHCENSRQYEQLVLREYLAYRILNLLTDQSHRVRLMRVTYVDTDGRRKDQTRYAFFIEHKKRLSRRLGAPLLHVEETTVAELDGEYLNLTSLFQYFIGNTDFSPIAGPPDSDCCHNSVLFKDGDAPILAIPYDWDQSGFVDAPYASPASQLKIRSVTQRLYRGRCPNNQYIDGSIAAFEAMRESIYSLIDNQQGLDERNRKQLRRFIDRFYKDIESPERVDKFIVGACRG